MKNKRVGVITDIYGVNEGVRSLVLALKRNGSNVFVVSPYDAEDLLFASQQDAYTAFREQCGHMKYHERVFHLVKIERCDVIIGFSAGASAAWLACANIADCRCKHLVCFYPTRIRKYLQAIPQLPTTLIFPKFEQSFSVSDLMEKLHNHKNVYCLRTPYQHGFLNPFLDDNYVKEAHNGLKKHFEKKSILCDPPESRRILELIFGMNE